MTPVADVNATLNKVNNVINILAIMLRLSQFLGCPSSLFKVFPILFFSFNLFFFKANTTQRGSLNDSSDWSSRDFSTPSIFRQYTRSWNSRSLWEKRGGKYPDQNFFCHSLTLYHYSHGLRTVRESFFRKSQNLGLGRQIGPLFLQKTMPSYPSPKYLFGIGIWTRAAKN